MTFSPLKLSNQFNNSQSFWVLWYTTGAFPMTWSEWGVVIPPWIVCQSKVGYHPSINVLLLLIASELTEIMIFLKPSFRHTTSGPYPTRHPQRPWGWVIIIVDPKNIIQPLKLPGYIRDWPLCIWPGTNTFRIYTVYTDACTAVCIRFEPGC